jgi:hypothetical protein
MSARTTTSPSPATTRPGVTALIQRLLARLDRRPPALARPAAVSPCRAPAGSRSGEGSASVLPYLAESLQTRPGSLED